MLRRTPYSILFPIVILAGFTLLSLPGSPLAAESKPKETLVVRRSRVLEYLRDKLKSEPNIDPGDLAALGNLMIEQKGFDYDFNACDLIDPDKIDSVLSPREETWDYPMTLAGGKTINLKIITDVPSGGGGGCDECFFSIPSLSVTTHHILIVSNTTCYRLKRPASFEFGEAYLMDNRIKRMVRVWQLPHLGRPDGISADGTKLYYGIYEEYGLDTLVLELSEGGSAKLRARNEVDLRDKGEEIEDYPKAFNNSDLYFIRFHVGVKNYIVGYRLPCT